MSDFSLAPRLIATQKYLGTGSAWPIYCFKAAGNCPVPVGKRRQSLFHPFSDKGPRLFWLVVVPSRRGDHGHSNGPGKMMSRFALSCRGLSVCVVVLAWSTATRGAEQSTSTQVAHAFWNAFLSANAEEMGQHYAPRVTIKAGSELLKRDYALSPAGERNKDLVTDRRAVIRAYQTMFERVGKAQWTDSSQKLRQVELSFISAADNNRYFALFQCHPSQMLVQVETQPEPLYFVLEQDGQQRWQVVAEAFD